MEAQVQETTPVVVIGAGPVGLAAAAHLRAYGLPHIVLESGEQAGAAVRAWGHVRTFTPWRWIVDDEAEKLLSPTGWGRPDGDVPPTGAEIADRYLAPLAAALGTVRTRCRAVAVTRDGLDKTRTIGREARAFVVRVEHADGSVEDLAARAVIDASGTWGRRNPLGASGLPAVGEAEAAAAGTVVAALPDVLGADRARFAGKRTLVVGMGHSAAGTLRDLARLAREVPGTQAIWAIRSHTARRLYGGAGADQLADRGRLGSDLQHLVEAGEVELVAGFRTTRLELQERDGERTVTVTGTVGSARESIAGVHTVVAATGFRPDLEMLSELRLDLDPGLESPRLLAPLIDPQFHSCGTVPPHGHAELAHPGEPGFYVVGAKSYGRAPTFLIATGNEQARSVVAAIAGDAAAADEVQLVLPETGVCSTSGADAGSSTVAADPAACCGASGPATVQGAGSTKGPAAGPGPGLAQGFATGQGGGLLAGLTVLGDTGTSCASDGGGCG
ncbi:hypothetical protein G9H71_12090 [Motilibacter sp. E257]|uniref:FAD-binding domain-containing protein n=1 Tax=Motilibacter deserti TaxID=2714956 RepID=A0ABX0GY51_9ACTN|nr:hypothetical protein [Motilibacter deserti]